MTDPCPPMPLMPEEPGSRREYRQSRANVHEDILSRRVLMHPDLLENEVDEDEDEEDGLPSPEPWFVDMRIDLMALLAKVPPGVDVRDVYLNLRDREHLGGVEVTLIHERPRDMAKEEADYRTAMAAYAVRRAAWEVETAAWDARQKAARRAELEKELEALK